MLVVYKGNQRRLPYVWKGSADDDRLREMHAKKMFATGMAAEIGCSVTTINTHLYLLGLVPHQKPTNSRGLVIERRTQPPVEKRNPIEEAYSYLNQKTTRLREENGNFVLDGRVAGLNDVVRALNQVLIANRIDQHKANVEWLVTSSEL